MCFFFGKKTTSTTTIFPHRSRVKCTYLELVVQYGVLWVFRKRWKTTHQTRAVSAASRGLCLQDPSPVGRPLGVFEFLSRLDICFQQQAVATWGGNFYGDQQLAFLWLGVIYFLW